MAQSQSGASPFRLTSDFDAPSPSFTSQSQHGFVQIAPSSQSQIEQRIHQIPGATIYTPTAAPGTELNPRSCVTCRRRKVRCDKHMPCSNCRRALIPCVFPAPERAPRRPRRKDPNAPLKPQQSNEREIELLKRLRKLEGIVEELSGQVELEASKQHSSAEGSPETSSSVHGDVDSTSNIGGNPRTAVNDSSSSTSASFHKKANGTQRKYGRLVINDNGRARYVSSAFWTKINDQLDELRAEAQSISQEENTDESDAESPPVHDGDNGSSPEHNAFIFGLQSTALDLRDLHPHPSQIPYLWQVYMENVDPIVKILHIPTTARLLRDARMSLDSISPANEALLFAIYYASVSSLDENEIKVNFLVEKPYLLSKYRFAVEQALAKAKFLVSSEIATLQALFLFVILARRHDDSRLAWTLTGLAIRICHSIGLHRDGENFPNLSPFETEMRRRLFWSLCMLDMRCAEEQGTDICIQDRGFDTKCPLNINDADISPDSTVLPQARSGVTDMTASLVRYEICRVARRLHVIYSEMGSACPVTDKTTLEEKERMIHDVYERVVKQFFSNTDTATNPMHWVAANSARLICAKLTLVIYQPILFPGPTNDMSKDLSDRLFTAATEVFEYGNILIGDPRTKPWKWLFQTFIQWHAVAFALMESARRPWSASVERAWNAVTSIFADPVSDDMKRIVENASVWLPFKMLYSNAKKHRTAEIQRLRCNPQEVARLDREDRSRLAPTVFSTTDGGLDGFQWRDRWLQLVGSPDLPDQLPDAQPSDHAFSSNVSQSMAATGAPQPQDCIPEPQNRPQQRLPTSQAPTHQMQDVETVQSPSAATTLMLDRMFAKARFEPTDLHPVVLCPDLPDNLAEISDFGNLSSEGLPRPADSLKLSSNNAQPGPLQGGLSVASGSGGTPTIFRLDDLSEDLRPPWLWTDNSNNNSNSNSNSNSNGNSCSGGGQTNFPARLADETEVDMGEDFDWHGFGQYLGDITNGVWSSHGI